MLDQKIAALRREIYDKLVSYLDPIVLNTFRRDELVVYELTENDTPLTRNIKALLNVLYYLQQLSEVFSLANLKELIEQVRALSKMDVGDIQHTLNFIYHDTLNYAMRFDSALQVAEKSFGIAEGRIKNVAQEVLAGMSKQSNSTWAMALVEMVQTLQRFEGGDRTHPLTDPSTVKPWLVRQMDFLIKKTEANVATNFSEQIKNYFVKVQGRYVIFKQDNETVRNTKATLNALTIAKELVDNYYGESNVVLCYSRLAVGSQDLQKAFKEIDYGAMMEDSAHELNLLLRKTLKELHPLLQSMVEYVDRLEESAYLREGVLMNHLIPCLDAYGQIATAAKVELPEPIPFWKSRLEKREARMHKWQAKLLAYHAQHHKHVLLLQALQKYKQTPLNQIPQSNLQFIKDNIELIGLPAEEQKNYLTEIETSLNDRSEPSQKRLVRLFNWVSQTMESSEHYLGWSNHSVALDLVTQKEAAMRNRLLELDQIFAIHKERVAAAQKAYVLQQQELAQRPVKPQIDRRLELLQCMRVIAFDAQWQREGRVFLWFGHKVPDGVKKIRAILSNLTDSNYIDKFNQIGNLIQKKVGGHQDKPRFRSNATHFFYQQYFSAIRGINRQLEIERKELAEVEDFSVPACEPLPQLANAWSSQQNSAIPMGKM